MEEALREEQRAAKARGENSFPDRKMQRYPSFFWREAGPFDWTECPDVEVVVGRLSGVPTLVHTRFAADHLLSEHEGGTSALEIAEVYGLDLSQVERVLDFATVMKKTASVADVGSRDFAGGDV